MRISGFTFIRNAVKYDYPIVESISSILNICNEVIILVGKSQDGTLKLVQSIKTNKIKIIETVWDDTIRSKGKILAQETNKALNLISKDSDWAFYIQGDEVIHEKDTSSIMEGLNAWKDRKEIEAILFNYFHFYGSYNHLANSYKWYRKEIRIIRNNIGIRSYGDAQGFRRNNKKLHVKLIKAHIYHYGWVKLPTVMQSKIKNISKYYSSKDRHDNFQYTNIDSLIEFDQSHPKIMKSRIKNHGWKFSYDIKRNKLSLISRIRKWIEKKTGLIVGEYRNYKLLK